MRGNNEDIIEENSEDSNEEIEEDEVESSATVEEGPIRLTSESHQTDRHLQSILDKLERLQ